MTRDDILKISRELLDGLLSGETKRFNKKHYFMFCVSKFVAVKELLVPKDIKPKRNSKQKGNIDTLFFDDLKYRDYIPAIKLIRDYINKTGIYKKNDINIELRSGKDDEDLKDAIWVFNKIRDSFAHGKFIFDLEHEAIIINNVLTDPNNSFKLKCIIPTYLLENVFTLVDNDINLKYNYKDMFSYSLPNYNNLLKYSHYDYNTSKTHFAEINKKYSDNKTSDSKRKKKQKEENFEELLSSISDKLSELLDKRIVSVTVYNLLRQYIEEYINNQTLTPEELSRCEGLITKVDAYEKLIEDKKSAGKERKYDTRTRRLIGDITKILNIGLGSKRTINNTPILVTHMLMLFSSNLPTNNPFLKTHFINQDGIPVNMSFDFSNDANYQTKIEKVKKEIQDFINRRKDDITTYNYLISKGKNVSSKVRTIYSNLIKLNISMKESLEFRNNVITSSVRNAAEHTHIVARGDTLHLWDTQDKTGRSGEHHSFDMKCSIDDLSDFLKFNFEQKTETSVLTDDDMFIELIQFTGDPKLIVELRNVIAECKLIVQNNIESLGENPNLGGSPKL